MYKILMILLLTVSIFPQNYNRIDLESTSYDFFRDRSHIFEINGLIGRRITGSNFADYISTLAGTTWTRYDFPAGSNVMYGDIHEGGTRYDYGYNTAFLDEENQKILIETGYGRIAENRFYDDSIHYYSNNISNFKSYSGSIGVLSSGNYLACGHFNAGHTINFYQQPGAVLEFTPEASGTPTISYPTMFGCVSSGIVEPSGTPYPGAFYGVYDMPVEVFNDLTDTYIITLQKYVAYSGDKDSLGMGLKLWERTDNSTWTEIYEWSESDRLLEVKKLADRTYLLIESTNRSSTDKGIYKLYRGVVNQIENNWNDSLYVVGLTATTNDLIASVSSQTADGLIFNFNDFSSTTGWYIQSGQGAIADIIYDGQVNYSNSNAYIYVNSPAYTSGKTYEIKIQIKDYESGTIDIKMATFPTRSTYSETISGSGYHTIYFTTTGTGSYFIIKPVNFTGNLDNLIIREYTGTISNKIERLYKLINGKWTFCGNMPFAANNVIRIGERLYMYYHQDRWGFTNCSNGSYDYIEYIYYTDDIPATTQQELNNYFIGLK
jgi:hypothetical protein